MILKTCSGAVPQQWINPEKERDLLSQCLRRDVAGSPCELPAVAANFLNRVNNMLTFFILPESRRNKTNDDFSINVLIGLGS